ncbi:MAG: hypothetical protein A2583_15795 [Bdellovibrionales bacterium RIFOXYD1_FULL_53_11]|nr:MAG: hypothetical protein A2583_15795 [Bdellovibrionales bacterium RIFOXYD1_FULL_53_11]
MHKWKLAPVPMAVLDDGGVISETNAAFSSMFGGTGMECAGSEAASLVHHEDVEFVQKVLLLVTKSCSRETFRARLRIADDCYKWYEFACEKTGDDGTLLAAWDISRSVEMELNVTGGCILHFDAFAAGLAHEINNPLSVAIGNTELISKYFERLDVPSVAIECVNKIDKSLKKIAGRVSVLKSGNYNKKAFAK